MKKYLIILLLASCTQKQPEPAAMSATLYYVTPTAMTTAINTAVSKSQLQMQAKMDSVALKQSKKDIEQDKQIATLQKQQVSDSLKIAALYDSINQYDTTFYNKDQFKVVGDTVNLK